MIGSPRRPAASLHRQSGLTLTALVLWLIPVVIVLITLAKVIPLYYEHRKIQEILRSMDESGQTKEASDRELRSSFDRRAEVDEVHSITANELVIDKVGDRKVVHVDYTSKVPLVDRVSLTIDFSASSAPHAGDH